LLGVGLDVFGRGFVATAAINLAGIACITGIAYFVGWLKTEPWRNAARTSSEGLGSAPAVQP
jgi:hypothetical protein